jgi:hypothetical protein
MLSVGVDYDGTLVDERGALRPLAKEAVLRIKRAGFRLVLHSARCNPRDPGAGEQAGAEFYATGRLPADVVDQWDRFAEMRANLIVLGLWSLFDEVWQSPGKPLVDIFVDDRAEEPVWAEVLAGLGIPMGVPHG